MVAKMVMVMHQQENARIGDDKLSAIVTPPISDLIFALQSDRHESELPVQAADAPMGR